MKKIFFLFLVLNLMSCGFKPRGEISLAPPLHHLYLKSSDPYGQLARNIIQDLKTSNVYFVSNPKQAEVILEIIKEERAQQLLSVGGTQQTRQYNLILTVIYQLTTPKGVIILPPQTVSETRIIPVQTNQILAGSNEANNLYHQMRNAIVYDIINRLASHEVSQLLMRPL